MLYPPSLPAHVKARAFRAANDELGILPIDAPAFLAACRADNVNVLGWELWVVDHFWDWKTRSPVPARGSWTGGIAMQDNGDVAVTAGEGDVDETEHQLASFDLKTEVPSTWLPYVRFNFTLNA
jgi:hypothetical protein